MDEGLQLDVAEKFIRILSQEEEFVYVIAIEIGVNDRDIRLTIVNENSEIELSYRVPRPPDGLFQACGLHATLVETDETHEILYFRPSKRLTGQYSQIMFPSAENPQWVLFKYTLEEPQQSVPVSMNLSTANLVQGKK